MQEILIKKQQTVPVYLNDTPTDAQKYGWLVAHGHGQRADFILKKCNRFDSQDHRVVSAEAGNRFYWAEDSQRPVATWMTSRLRLEDIQNNNDYFDEVYDRYIADRAVKVLFGFSQGGTTLWRWIHDRQPDFDVFINYAGWVPEDIDLSILDEYARGKKLIFCSGNTDQYLTPSRILALYEVVEKSTLKIALETFEGGHAVSRDVLYQLSQKYILK